MKQLTSRLDMINLASVVLDRKADTSSRSEIHSRKSRSVSSPPVACLSCAWVRACVCLYIGVLEA